MSTISHFLLYLNMVILKVPEGPFDHKKNDWTHQRRVKHFACYVPGSSLYKRNNLQGKDGSTSVLQDLTNGSVQGSDVKDGISGVMSADIKGQPLTAVVEAGLEDTGSDGYR